MRTSSLVATLFAVGSLAAPVKRAEVVDMTVVTEIDYVDQSGHLLSESVEVGRPAPSPEAPVVQAPPPEITPPAPKPTVTAGSFLQNKPAPSPAAPVPSPAAPAPAPASSAAAAPSKAAPAPAPANNKQSGSSDSTQQGATANALHVGWVDPTDEMFGQIAVYHTNLHRTNHSVGSVTYDDTLAAAAQDWANKCVTEEEVPEGSGYGMNVAFSSSTDNYNPSYFITGGWYNSELDKFPQYGVGSLPVSGAGSTFGSWGHFSQLVWPDTVKIGCGVAKCGNGWAVHAGCMYYPAGNMMGDFNKVKPPVGNPVVFPNGQNSF